MMHPGQATLECNDNRCDPNCDRNAFCFASFRTLQRGTERFFDLRDERRGFCLG